MNAPTTTSGIPSSADNKNVAGLQKNAHAS
jgi:hypothetical protein